VPALPYHFRIKFFPGKKESHFMALQETFHLFV